MDSQFVNDKHTQNKALAHTELTLDGSDTHINFPDEIAHLAEIREKLLSTLKAHAETVDHYNKEYMNTKRYLADYRQEIDPKEIFQNELSMNQIERAGILAVQMRERVNRLLDSPYFARIDFFEEGEQEPSVFYIGSYTFTEKNRTSILIYDWRSPVASMFYDCELGQAGYDAPIGRVEGKLTRKRQYKISGGVMEYVLESNINIQDDVLQRELSNTSDEKMKTIIATIQREQNRIIRNEHADTLIIQGVAGSGKTSIALHRIAYLLYRYKETLSSGNVVILSPNKVFADYISNVLPELGEEPIYEMSFADICETQLSGKIQFQQDRDPLGDDDCAWAERVRFKSGIDFVNKMEQYLQQAVNTGFEPVDIEFGRFKAAKEWVLTRYNSYQNYPVKTRLYEVAVDIYEKFTDDNHLGDEIPKQKVIYSKLVDMFKFKNTLALYKDFYQTIKATEKLVMPDKLTLEWADAAPFLYFHAAFEGLKENQSIKHIVIDEMQDYTPAQFAVINKIFKCKKTILGDFGQSINPNYSNSLTDLERIYTNAEIVELNKSYRSSWEIINFAKSILKDITLEAIERHGDAPEIISANDYEDELAKLIEKIQVFQNSRYGTLGIILKTNSEAGALYNVLIETLPKDSEIQFITPDSKKFSKGITVSSIQMSKGLEFDEVIILSANSKNYHTDYDRKLLYVACTRAMHKLSLIYTGEPSSFIKGC